MLCSRGFLALVLLLSPAVARGQSFEGHGAIGPTMVDRGISASAGIGYTPTSRLTLIGAIDLTHLASRITPGSTFRGGTVVMGSGEIRVSLLGRDRVSPYVLAGFGAGVTRPNVNDLFTEPTTNAVRAVFAGVGLQVPLPRRALSLFADGRMIVGDERSELLAIVPVRAGLSWRF